LPEFPRPVIRRVMRLGRVAGLSALREEEIDLRVCRADERREDIVPS
jgi:hypothetical protein